MDSPCTSMERWLNDAEEALWATIRDSADVDLEVGVSPSCACPEWNNLVGGIASYRAFLTGYYLGNGPATLALWSGCLLLISQRRIW